MSDSVSVFDVLTGEERDLLAPAPSPGFVEPMLATLSSQVVTGGDWVYERKLDGVRLLGCREGAGVTLFSRTAKLQNGTYPEIADALATQPRRDFLVDGEVVAFEGNRTSFARLQGRMQLRDPERARQTGIAVAYYAFDLLHLEGHDTTRLPLLARKRLLESAFAFGDEIRSSDHSRADGRRLLEEACKQGWEGLIAKRAGGRYVHRRSRDWLKLKCANRQELVIGGWTEPEGAREVFGALLVGYHEGGELVYAGKVGTGFDARTLRDLGALLAQREQGTPPFSTPGLPRRGVHWVHPDLVCEVAFSEWTPDGRLRHPRFVGLRDDKPAHTVVREVPAA